MPIDFDLHVRFDGSVLTPTVVAVSVKKFIDLANPAGPLARTRQSRPTMPAGDSFHVFLCCDNSLPSLFANGYRQKHSDPGAYYVIRVH